MSITLLRHCQSLYNEDHIKNKHLKNVSLSSKGKSMAKTLNGHYDIVLLSPMYRTVQTLKLSNITFDKLIIRTDIREYKQTTGSFFESEDSTIKEEHLVFKDRVFNFKLFLDDFKDLNILVIGHGLFFKELMSNKIEHFENGQFYCYK